MFKNIKIFQHEPETEKCYWSFGWKFEYKGNEYGNYIDNKTRTKEKLDCENQIAMLKLMILAMEKICK